MTLVRTEVYSILVVCDGRQLSVSRKSLLLRPTHARLCMSFFIRVFGQIASGLCRKRRTAMGEKWVM